MEVYLSSYRLGSEPQRLRELVGGNKKAAVIPNALDYTEDIERRNNSIKREIESLNSLGLEAEELDLRNYFDDNNSLAEKLNDLGLVWALGGNSFILRRAMRQSGFDEVIKQYKTENKPDFVYAGYSAGAVVATPTLHGIEIADDRNVAPSRYDPNVIWEGLGLVDYSIAPHYRSDHPESEIVEDVVKYFEDNKMPFKPLSDGEIIVVQF